MPRYAVIHPSLNRRGGAEVLCIQTIRVLKERGLFVALYTFDKTDWGPIGEDIRPDIEKYVYKDHLEIRNPWDWFVLGFLYLCMMIDARFRDLYIINHYGEVFPFIADISWIHSIPIGYMVRERNAYNVPYWEYLAELFNISYRILLWLAPSRYIVTNSTYNQGIIKKTLGLQSNVIHPFLHNFQAMPILVKQPIVLTVSRLNSTKNLEIINQIEKHTNVQFIVTGKTTEQTSQLGLNASISLVPDPSNHEIKELMNKSTVYLSTLPTEAFGMAIVEAMAYGCVPVVPRDGGPWNDILETRQGINGYSYSSPEEAAEHINKITRNQQLYDTLSKNTAKRARGFTRNRFDKRFIEMIIFGGIPSNKRHDWINMFDKMLENVLNELVSMFESFKEKIQELLVTG